jgi:L-alanine-DL-glutamate epimerase-like enolase superfamily enzyme
MAFVRRKKMGGKYYYQLVRNYRDGGRHRQKVLCHLGTHDTIEGAIDAAKEKAAFHEEAASSKRNEADSIKAKLHDLYGDDVEIYSEEEAETYLAYLRNQDPRKLTVNYYRGYDEQAIRLMIDEWEVVKQQVDLCIDFHEKVRSAETHNLRAKRYKAKLYELSECQQKYS